MNVKSQSKKLFGANKTKLLIDPLIKRHKSQESYSDARTLLTDKNPKIIKGLPRTKYDSEGINNNKLLSGGKKADVSPSTNTSNSTSKKHRKISQSKMIFSNKEDESVRHIQTEANVINLNFENEKFKTIDEKSINKIFLNLTKKEKNKNAHLKTNNNENFYDDCDIICESDEMRTSEINDDFYINSICEASGNILEKGEGLINILPKPFVKQAENKIFVSPNTSNSNINEKKSDDLINKTLNTEDTTRELEEKNKKYLGDLYRKLLIYSKKGDRDAFLEILNSLFKSLGNKTSINYKDENGWTALHYSCDEGNLKIVEILMKMNVDVNMKTFNKKTPLHIAANKGYFDISRILIENGGTISTLDDEKNSPIHLCAMRGHVELLRYFLERHPQADSKNIYGKSPMDLAKNDKIKDVLRDYLNKNTYHYHKITIHDIDSKCANNLLYGKSYSPNGNTNNANHLKKNKNEHKGNTRGSPVQAHMKIESKDLGGTISKIKKDHDSSKNNNNISNVNNNSNNNSNNSNTQISLNAYSSRSKKIFNPVSSNFLRPNTNTNPNKHFPNKFNTLNNNEKSLNMSPNNNQSQFTNINININLSKNKIATNYEDYANLTKEVEDEPIVAFSSLDEERIGPSSFVCHALLGKGSFGEVYLVEKKDTCTLYAMKVLSKDKIMLQNLVKYAMTERNVLSVTDHPFMVKLNYAFQSNDKLFLILDYAPNGDLAEHLTRERKFSEERAKIYLCEIILALEDLHKRDIIFRDLKPDNVVLDSEGHALLTDFGLSKEGVLDNKGAKSFCG